MRPDAAEQTAGRALQRASHDLVIGGSAGDGIASTDNTLHVHVKGSSEINLSDIHVLVSHLGGHRDNIDTVRSGSLAVTPSAARAIELGGDVGVGLLLQRIVLGSLRLHLGRGGGVSHRIATI